MMRGAWTIVRLAECQGIALHLGEPTQYAKWVLRQLFLHFLKIVPGAKRWITHTGSCCWRDDMNRVMIALRA